jgi:hypothetical protein
MEYLTSVEVAQRFNLGLTTLTKYLSLHPHLRPKRRAGTSFIWTPEEVEALAQHRARPISRGRKKQE